MTWGGLRWLTYWFHHAVNRIVATGFTNMHLQTTFLWNWIIVVYSNKFKQSDNNKFTAKFRWHEPVFSVVNGSYRINKCNAVISRLCNFEIINVWLKNNYYHIWWFQNHIIAESFNQYTFVFSYIFHVKSYSRVNLFFIRRQNIICIKILK